MDYWIDRSGNLLKAPHGHEEEGVRVLTSRGIDPPEEDEFGEPTDGWGSCTGDQVSDAMVELGYARLKVADGKVYLSTHAARQRSVQMRAIRAFAQDIGRPLYDDSDRLIESRDDIANLPLPASAKAYVRRSGMGSVKRQPKDALRVAAELTGHKAGDQFVCKDDQRLPDGTKVGKRNMITAEDIVEALLAENFTGVGGTGALPMMGMPVVGQVKGLEKRVKRKLKRKKPPTEE